MNKLSWLLYAANVFDNLQVTLGIACFVSAFATVVWFISYAHDVAETKPSKGLLFSCLGCGFTLCFIPSATTVYMIAGSEASEVAVKSEIGQKVMTAVEKAIDSYTKKDNR